MSGPSQALSTRSALQFVENMMFVVWNEMAMANPGSKCKL